MEMGRRVGVFSGLVVAAGLALAAPNGSFAATTLGQTLVPSNTCATDTTYLQTVSPGPSYTASFSGVITSWSYQADGAPPASIKLKVGRVAPGTDLSTDANITVVGESTSQVPTANTLNNFLTQISVQAGDFIGFYLGPTMGFSVGCESLDNSFRNQYNNSDVAPGAMPLFTDEGGGLDLAAVLEADCNRNGLGDDTQDPDLTACHSNSFTFAGVTRNKKKGTATLKVNVPEPGELIGSGNGAKVAAGATTSKAVTPGTAQLLIKAKGKKKRKLNQTGKVKLSVAVTYTPTGGKPNTQSIKVKLKK
jgi:hypothetical protein